MSEVLKKDCVELKSLRYVEVKWLDAAMRGSWVNISGEGEDIDVAVCVSRGWVVSQDDKQIVLCGTVGMNKDGLVEDANATMAIPSPMIQSITDFPARRKRKAPVAKVEPKP